MSIICGAKNFIKFNLPGIKHTQQLDILRSPINEESLPVVAADSGSRIGLALIGRSHR